jgi:hypothetical protein
MKNQKDTKIQILKENISGKKFWTDVSEPLTLPESQSRMVGYSKTFPKNKYQIVAVK